MGFAERRLEAIRGQPSALAASWAMLEQNLSETEIFGALLISVPSRRGLWCKMALLGADRAGPPAHYPSADRNRLGPGCGDAEALRLGSGLAHRVCARRHRGIPAVRLAAGPAHARDRVPHRLPGLASGARARPVPAGARGREVPNRADGYGRRLVLVCLVGRADRRRPS
jgi:hypothetical protein